MVPSVSLEVEPLTETVKSSIAVVKEATGLTFGAGAPAPLA